MYHVSEAGRLTGFTYTISSDGAVLRIATNHFSVYTMAERVAAGSRADGTRSPLTGDILAFGWSLTLLSLSAITIIKLLVFKKRVNRKSL
jgi:hypothetical protein